MVINGLPVEFYKAFWPIMGQDLLMVLRVSIKKGLLPLSCRRAVITLLPKKGNLQDISNWRPVSLLCSEYKILSKSLAMRLKKVISQVVHSDQSYCIPGRSIFDNIALVRDLLTVAKSLGLNAGLISLDQQKAFDRVEHQFLWSTFECFGFSPGFISMVKTIYCDIESVLKVNGGLSSPFKVKRGIRQGCPMSGMLYSIAIEPLLHMLRSNLRGFSVPSCNKPFILSAYADDVITFVSCKDDIDMLTNVVNDFQSLSSAKVNWGKSDALWVGEWEDRFPGLPGGLRLLTAPGTLAWRPLAHCILHGVNSLGLDSGLFLMDSKKLALDTLPSFYKSLFRVWGLFSHTWVGLSLHWLLEEPIVFGSRFDVAGSDCPGLTGLLCDKGAIQLRHIVDKAGGNLQDSQAVASLLGVKSVRYIDRFLGKLKGVLNHRETSLLKDYDKGNAFCNCNDVFPNILLSPVLRECGHGRPLLVLEERDRIDLSSVTRKMLYKNLVKVLNKNTLKGRSDTVWRDRLGFDDETKPVWRVIYKPPITKRTFSGGSCMVLLL